MAPSVDRIRRWYVTDELSGPEIAARLGIPANRVYRILERNRIARRKFHESRAIQFFRQKLSFRIKTKLGVADRQLLTTGVMLYWAEGSHPKGKAILDFANSNPDMVRIYIRFLREICGVREDRLRMYLYAYANQNIEHLKRFWSKLANIPLKQFSKPYIRHDFRADKIGKMPYGLVHVRYADKKLYSQLENWQSTIVRQFLGR